MGRRGRDEGGYSLIELVVSILVFALGMMGVMKMQQQAVMGGGFSMQMGNALTIADTQAEYLRGVAITDSNMDLGDHDGAAISPLQGVTYTLSWTVNTTALGGSVNARDVDIVVSWTEKGLSHQVTMNMFRST